MPALNDAVNSINVITKQDINEIKAMKKPPKVIKLILKILCIIFKVHPIMKKPKDGNAKPKPSYFLAAHSKELLGNPNLP